MGIQAYTTRDGRRLFRVDSWVVFPDGTSKRIRKSRIPTKPMAVAYEQKLRAGAFEGVHFARPKTRTLTVGGAWEAYSPGAELEKRSWPTDCGRAAHLLQHLGQRRCATLTQRDVDNYRVARLAEKTKRGGKPAIGTLNREVALLKRLLSYAVKCGDLDRNPLQGVGLLEEDNTRDVIVSEAQLQQLVAAAAPVFRPLVIVAYDSGMRRSEVTQLQWRQVDLKAGVIRLQAEDTKTHTARDVFLTARAKAALEGLARSTSGYVFVNPKTNKPWTDIRKQFRKACKDAKLPGVWFHDLRRSFVTNARRRGVAESVVMKLSGHRTREVFARYNIIDDSDLRSAVAMMEVASVAERAATEAMTAKASS